ncbi:DUF1707 SHOCT-like domain-containing protein [Actinomycetospora chibensis]|uniref:DUF1707 domain-containing protein n=1 Tax=Actinomycetospora chibensis TaxID=663606 RepID=A0ABV9RG61_9PSEU|nr:DUF1707 domain-containing protein [Actinomycetospora chibensis]MDD7926733.1 DUF1707 domain-containing protein [Actinomycetospora chibensis]
MSEPAPNSSPRIGTAEREAALADLGAHLEAGRLDPEEYGERSAKVTEARTAADLEPLFADLPEPRPHRGAGAVAAPVTGAAPRAGGPSALARWGPAVSGALPIIALILFFTVPIANSWVFFLLIPLGGALFAQSRRADDGRRDRDE